MINLMINESFTVIVFNYATNGMTKFFLRFDNNQNYDPFIYFS